MPKHLLISLNIYLLTAPKILEMRKMYKQVLKHNKKLSK